MIVGTMNSSGADNQDQDLDSIRFEIPFLTFVCIAGSLGNALVILVYTRRAFRKSNATSYILNLAGGDLLALLVVLFHVTEYFPITWPVLWAHNWQCQLHRYLRFVAFNNTVMTMTAIAVDRYYAVRKPMVFKLKFSVKRTKFLIIFLWVLALAAAVPTAFMFKSVYADQDDKNNYQGKTPFACKLSLPFGDWFKDFKAIYLNVVLFLFPVTITSVLFVRIVLHVRRSNLAINKNFENAASAIRNSHWTTARSLLVVFVVFLFCYMPFAMYNIMQRYAPNVLSANFNNVALLLPYVNSCLNPVVYSFTSERFRRYSVRVLCPCNRKTMASRHPFTSGDSAASDQQIVQRFASVLPKKDYK